MTFDKIIGYKKEKDELMRICDVLKRYKEYEKLGVKIPHGLMIEGVPGIGKTLMAKCLIQESGLKCIELRKDSAKKNFVNKISNAFAKAKEDAQNNGDIVIIFMDDLDKFAQADDIDNKEEFAVVQSGIESVKDSRVFVIATVNDRDMLPDSLRRKGRFDMLIHVKKPKCGDSKQLLEFWLKDKCVDLDDMGMEMLSKFLYSHTGSEIESFVNEAGTYAVYENRTVINFDDLARAYARICLDFDVRFAPDFSHAQLERVAYHEAGHAVLGLLSKSREVTMVCIGSSADSSGIASFYQKYSGLSREKEAIEETICLFGGKAAEKVVFGDAAMGCNSDLWKIGFSLSSRIADLAINGFEDFIPFAVEGKMAPKLYDRISTDISKSMQEYYDVACDLLAKNRPLLDTIASKLLDKNYLTMPEIYAIFDEYKKNCMPVYIQV